MAKERMVGIDFGTTNSLVAYMEATVPWSFREKMGESGAVHRSAGSEGQIVVGNAARKYLIETPERAVYTSSGSWAAASRTCRKN